MSVNYADSSVPTPDKNGHDGDKSAKTADPSSSNNDNLNGEIDRGLLYSDESSHNTPSPTPTRAIGLTRNELQSVSDGEIETDECTEDVVSSSNQRQDKRKEHRQRRSGSNLSGGGNRKGHQERQRQGHPNPRGRSSMRSVIGQQRREGGRGMESPRERRKRLREDSKSPSPTRRGGRGRSSKAGSDGGHNDRGRRGRSVAVTRKEGVKRSPSQLPERRRGILTFEQIKVMN